MIDTRFQWLEDPNPSNARRPASFRVKYKNTLATLDDELGKMGARDLVIAAGYVRDDLRPDGWPRSQASPKHPACCLYFEDRNRRRLSMPCDTFDRFEDNLRAITLTLEHLRAVDRYGVTKGSEQYVGWLRLEAGGGEATLDDQLKTAFAVIDRFGGFNQLADRSLAALFAHHPGEFMETYTQRLRWARGVTHPDVNSGDRKAWDAVERAWNLVKAKTTQGAG